MSSNDQVYQKQPAVEMNDLPNELLLFIFKHLKIKDLIQCRWVCKSFQHVCDEVKMEGLVIANETGYQKDYFFHTTETFNHADSIDIQTFTMVRSKFRVDQLKRLYFKGTSEDYRRVHLNDFTQLEQLTICLSDYGNHRRVVDIILPNLKVLDVRCSCYEYKFQLNTPELESLKCSNPFSITIHHPDSIKHLDAAGCNSVRKRLNIFKNVEYLKFSLANLRMDPNFLSPFPKLKTLLCIHHNPLAIQPIEEIDALRQLVEQRPELTIYFQSVKLDTVKKIDEYDPQKLLAFQVTNYDSLCDDVIYHGYRRVDVDVDYNELMGLVNGNLPNDFYKKYFDIRSVKVSENVESEEHFVEFVKRLEHLHNLHLENVSFNQDFYDRLPEMMEQLSFLLLGRGLKPINNYDFLFKMKLLERLRIDQGTTEFFDLTLALFSRSKRFKSIDFHFDKENLWIWINSRNKFKVVREKEDAKEETVVLFVKREMNFDELVGLLTTFKNTGLMSNRTH